MRNDFDLGALARMGCPPIYYCWNRETGGAEPEVSCQAGFDYGACRCMWYERAVNLVCAASFDLVLCGAGYANASVMLLLGALHHSGAAPVSLLDGWTELAKAL